MKTYGLNARCVVCSIEPFALDDPEGRGFTLKRFNSSGTPTSGSIGQFFCQAHYPSKKHASRSVITPLAALSEFERALAAESARLEEAVADCSDDNVATAFKDYSEELERALSELRKTFAAQALRDAKTVQAKRPKPLTLAGQDDRQADLMGGEPAPLEHGEERP